MKQVCIKSKWYIHPDCIDEVIESTEENLIEGESVPEHEEWWYDTEVFSLQEILDLTKDMDPKDVTINIYRDRYIRDITVALINIKENGK